MSHLMFCSLINELVDNLPDYTLSEPQEINLVIDNGAFNGLYLYGVLLYFKKLESLKRIKIIKISGTSIGAILSLFYLIDELESTQIIFQKMRDCWKEKFDFNDWKSIIKEMIDSKVNQDKIKNKINNKIFINYIDTKLCKEIVKNTFKDKDELFDTLYKTSFIPFLMNGELSYNNCIDGCNPMLFDERTQYDNKCIFISLMNPKIILNSIKISNDKNISYRAIEGINETHKFFINENQNLCSYINEWRFKDLLIYRIRQIIYLIIIYIVHFIIILKSYIPISFYDLPICNFISGFSYKIYKDFLLKTLL